MTVVSLCAAVVAAASAVPLPSACAGLPAAVANASWPANCSGAGNASVCAAACLAGFSGAPRSTCINGNWSRAAGSCNRTGEPETEALVPAAFFVQLHSRLVLSKLQAPAIPCVHASRGFALRNQQSLVGFPSTYKQSQHCALLGSCCASTRSANCVIWSRH